MYRKESRSRSESECIELQVKVLFLAMMVTFEETVGVELPKWPSGMAVGCNENVTNTSFSYLIIVTLIS